MIMLENQTVFVTGAAQGVGRGIALAMAGAGANIIVGDLNTDKAEVVVSEVKALGREAIAAELDVTNKASIDRAFTVAFAHFPSIHVLVNNAGVMQKGVGEQTSTDDFDFCHEVNVKSIWLVTQVMATHFKIRKSGKIINIGSGAGRQGIADFPAYCASKAAAINLTQSLSHQLAPFNINVNALCPGLVWTPMWEQIEGMMEGNHEVKARKKFSEGVENTPLGRAITPEDIGNAAVFLASDAAKNITGQSLNIDGGLIHS